MNNADAVTGPRPDQIQGHRGASAVAPENTLAAFRAAREQGALWVEFDVSLLGDGTLVISHDDMLDRCTSRTGSLGTIGRADLDDIDAGSWFGPGFRGERMPTFAETLEVLGQLGLNANVEIKQHPHHGSLADYTEAVHSDLKARSGSTEIMISSFDVAALQAMQRLDESYDLAMLWDRLPDDWEEVLASIPSKAIHLNFRELSYRVLENTAKRDVAVRVWTCNNPALLTPFWSQGLAGVITDDPSLYLSENYGR